MEARVLKGPSSIPSVTDKTLGEYYFKCAEIYGDRIYQIDATTGQQETFKSVQKRSIRLAIAMQNKNITSDYIVVVCCDNHLDSIIPVLSTLYLGAKVACLDTSLHVRDTKHLLHLLKPKMLFVDAHATQLIEASISNKLSDMEIIVVGKSGKYQTFSELIESKENEDIFKPVHVPVDETAILFLSSGTTGLPKGICLSHRAFLSNSVRCHNMGFNFEVLLHFTTLYWTSAAFMMSLGFIEGSTRILCGEFRPEIALQVIEQYKVTFSFLSPFLVHKILDCPTKYSYNLSSLNCLVIGGGTIGSPKYLAICNVFKDTFVTLSYGLTEAGFVTIFYPDTDKELMKRKDGSSGKLSAGVELKIVEAGTQSKILGPYQKGEILVRNSGLMSGYYNLDYSHCFDQDGFLKTGDYGYYDEDECIYIIDRLKEIIEYQLWHVIPSSIETVLLEHPAIREAVVFGLPDEVDGELPTAMIVVKDNLEITIDEITEYVNQRVHDREKLRGGIIIVDNIPRTPSGKVRKWHIREIVMHMKNQI